MSNVRTEPRDARGYPWVGGWNARDMYGLLSRGYPEMANAFMNQDRRGGAGGHAESFSSYQARTGRGDASRGWGGLPRVPRRCSWPLWPCPGQPCCTARHVVGAAETREAA